MSFWQQLRKALLNSSAVRAQDGGVREHGLPPSANGASSMHARWLDLPAGVVAVEVDLTIQKPPDTSHLHFWALQASFMEAGVSLGAGHLGLQWIQGHPGSTAVNWGGYRAEGGELDGTQSQLPSGRNNPHTRDYSWVSGEPYRLRIDRGVEGWRGSVTRLGNGERTVVRELKSAGSYLDSIVVWSEVFAPCEGPSTSVQWSNPIVRVSRGSDTSNSIPIEAFKLSYQGHSDGGCTNTDSSLANDERGLIQRTAITRHNAHGSVLRFAEVDHL